MQINAYLRNFKILVFIIIFEFSVKYDNIRFPERKGIFQDSVCVACQNSTTSLLQQRTLKLLIVVLK